MQMPYRSPPPAPDWLAEFHRRHGRAPRVLHIGNIAMNAYRIAKLLNEAGVQCDVACYDYYHAMACPEWEDALFEGAVDEQAPNWGALDLRGYERPRWFAQGPAALCIDYLAARRDERADVADRLWRKLQYRNRTSKPLRHGLDTLRSRVPEFLRSWLWENRTGMRIAERITRKFDTRRGIENELSIALMLGALLAVFAGRAVVLPFKAAWRVWERLAEGALARVLGRARRREFLAQRSAEVAALFRQTFPDHKDVPTIERGWGIGNLVPEWKALFERYDLVQGYALDPILPLLAGKRPYVGFEHGTLRTFTHMRDPVSRLTALAYNQADHVFITNGDCLDYARRIGVGRFSPMVHPIDEARIQREAGDRNGLRRRLGTDRVFLCTIRHDWIVKGTDRYIRALPALHAELDADFVVLMTTWGAQVHESRELAESLGVGRLIRWIDPMPRAALIRALKSCDILFDQLALPHFGASAPEGIAAGIPVIMSNDPSFTEWIVSEPAPILAAGNTDEIVNAVKTALDPVWLENYAERARRWIDTQHSSRRVLDDHLRVYADLLAAEQARGKTS